MQGCGGLAGGEGRHGFGLACTLLAVGFPLLPSLPCSPPEEALSGRPLVMGAVTLAGTE